MVLVCGVVVACCLVCGVYCSAPGRLLSTCVDVLVGWLVGWLVVLWAARCLSVSARGGCLWAAWRGGGVLGVLWARGGVGVPLVGVWVVSFGRAPMRGLWVGWGCGGCGLRSGVVLLRWR